MLNGTVLYTDGSKFATEIGLAVYGVNRQACNITVNQRMYTSKFQFEVIATIATVSELLDKNYLNKRIYKKLFLIKFSAGLRPFVTC